VITDNYRKDPSVGTEVWRVYVIVKKNKRKKQNAERIAKLARVMREIR